MSSKKETAPENNQIVELAPVLDLLTAEKLKEDLKLALSGDNLVQIDASKVTRVSTACLQIVVAAKRVAVESANDTSSFKVTSPSDPFIEATQNLGLADILLEEAL